MRVHLLSSDAGYDPGARAPWNADALVRDLALDTLFETMAAGDELVGSVARHTLLAGQQTDVATVEWRQAILRDAIANPDIVLSLYGLAGEALTAAGKSLGILIKYPHWVLRESLDLITRLLDSVRRLRRIAEQADGLFEAPGWVAFFAMVKQDLGDAYLAEIERHVAKLRLRGGVRLAAGLGKGNKAAGYMFLEPPEGARGGWLSQLLAVRPRYPGFDLHPRDESGARILSEIQDNGLKRIASAVGHSAHHMKMFFTALRHELAFYVGGLNLHRAMSEKDMPVCWPVATAEDGHQLSFRSLADLQLVLRSETTVMPNDLDADGRTLIIVTGANQGGKSTFLRSFGIAQLMMQSGLFVPARRYAASLCDGLFTHYKREEDSAMDSGKLDEELTRMSGIVDHLGRHPLILFNESFAATNEHEGAEISRQIVGTLHDAGIRIVCVTHLYSFARSLHRQADPRALFLRADRQDSGERTFRLIEGEPLSTSFGRDLYQRIFRPDPAAEPSAATPVGAETE
ncbi:MutS-related protein [Sphingomonas oryzagri]